MLQRLNMKDVGHANFYFHPSMKKTVAVILYDGAVSYRQSREGFATIL